MVNDMGRFLMVSKITFLKYFSNSRLVMLLNQRFLKVFKIFKVC